MRPDSIVDRDFEWSALEAFVASNAPGLQVGLLYGRRRTGKSFLLRHLARAQDGLYALAAEEEPQPALTRFAGHVAARLQIPSGALRFAGWEQALRTATGIMPDGTRGGAPLLIIDELPYLLNQPPGAAIPSLLQMLVDETRDNPGPPRRVIVCGSALSVMSELLSGTRALRGRATLDLLLKPFDYRTAAGYYRIADPETAFQLHAVLGGTPGYRDLLPFVPQQADDIPRLLAVTLLSPAHALFSETSYLLREDPRITDRALYHSVLAAIAAGDSTPSKIGARLGRDSRSLTHVLDVLISAGFVVRDEDLLVQRRPRLRLADQAIAFHQLVTAPRRDIFEDHRVDEGWAAARAAYESGLLGPHFEHLAREWVRRYAAAGTLGGPVGEVGATVVNDPSGRAQHEVDVVALAAGQRRHTPDATVKVLGEAKSSRTARRLGDLTRLERIRELLTARGLDASGARLLLFGRSGFDAELTGAAGRREDVVLVDLARLYRGD